MTIYVEKIRNMHTLLKYVKNAVICSNHISA